MKPKAVESIKRKSRSIYIHGELPARFKRQMNVNDASWLKNSKQTKSGPKQKFYDQNLRWNTFPTSMSFSSYGSPMIVPWGTYFGMPYSHAPWFHNSYMSFLSTYLCPNYITYREPVISEPSPTDNDRFVQKNREPVISEPSTTIMTVLFRKIGLCRKRNTR